jgi:hypothetical protein
MTMNALLQSGRNWLLVRKSVPGWCKRCTKRPKAGEKCNQINTGENFSWIFAQAFGTAKSRKNADFSQTA